MERAVVMVHKLMDGEEGRRCCRQDFIKEEAAAENMAQGDGPSSRSHIEEIYIKSEVPDAELEGVTVKDEPIGWHQEPQASSSSGSDAVTFKREVDNDCVEAHSKLAEAQDELMEGSSGACSRSAVRQGPGGASQGSAASPPSDVLGSGSGVEAAPPDTLTSRPLLCAHCVYSCDKKACMRQHLRVTHKLGCYECELCAYSTKNKSALKRHIRKRHNNENLCKGLSGGYQYSVVKMMREQRPEKLSQEKLKCKFCGSILVIKSSTEAPEICASDNSKVYMCEVCKFSSANEANLKQCLTGKRKIRHKKSKRGQGHLNVRELNHHTTALKNEHEVHQVGKDGKAQLFMCDLCNYSSARKNNVKQHLASKHGKGQLFRCELCEYFSAAKNRFEQHLALKHGKGQLFKCEFCEYFSACKDYLKLHLASKHGEGELFKCEFCDYSSAQKSCVKIHRASKHGEGQMFKCELCDYYSANKSCVKLHRANKHGEGELFKCHLCEYSSAREYYLKLHLASKHGEGQLLKCELCDFSSAHKSSLKEHRGSKHGEGQQFKCELCDYSSARKYSIKLHLARKHGEVQLFKCELCDYSSAREYRVKQHRAGKHGRTDSFPI